MYNFTYPCHILVIPLSFPCHQIMGYIITLISSFDDTAQKKHRGARQTYNPHFSGAAFLRSLYFMAEYSVNTRKRSTDVQAFHKK